MSNFGFETLRAECPGHLGGRYEVAIPDSYKKGHEAHFSQVAERFLGFLKDGGTPVWEAPNTLAKYKTIMQAYQMSRVSK